MADFGNRLRSLRGQRQLKQKELAAALAVPRSTIASWEAGHRTPEISAAQRLADFFAVSLDYLLGRNAPGEALEPQAGYRAETPSAPTEWILVPVFGVVRAGEPLLAIQDAEGRLAVPAADLRGGEHFFLRVKGDSMTGARIHDGDLVLVRRQPEVENGEIGVVLVDDEEATVKRVFRLEDKWLLQPENPTHRPLILPRRAVRVLGKVVRVQFDV
ncbi:MAG: S24 family peptidase [Chitinophagales bacterium]